MTIVAGEWPAQGVQMRVTRGSFIIPAALFDDGREDDLARYFARSMPENAKPGRREKLRDGCVRLHWRIIRVVAA